MPAHYKPERGRRQGTPIYRADGKIIGHVIGDEFRKTIHDRHFLQKPRGLASDVDTLRQAQDAEAVWFVAYHVETGREYRAPIRRFFERGISVNRGHSPQLALILPDFNKDDAAPTPTTPKPTQPLLFALPRMG